jgi:hypothetical protein
MRLPAAAAVLILTVAGCATGNKAAPAVHTKPVPLAALPQSVNQAGVPAEWTCINADSRINASDYLWWCR